MESVTTVMAKMAVRMGYEVKVLEDDRWMLYRTETYTAEYKDGFLTRYSREYFDEIA